MFVKTSLKIVGLTFIEFFSGFGLYDICVVHFKNAKWTGPESNPDKSGLFRLVYNSFLFILSMIKFEFL